MAGFDPDKYLAEKTAPVEQAGASQGFDPDQYLAQKMAPPVKSDNYFGPGGAVPRWLESHPDAQTLVRGTLEQAPTLGAIIGGTLGGTAGAIEGAPTMGTASIPLAIGQGMMGAAAGGSGGKVIEDAGKHYLLGDQMKSNAEQIKDNLSVAKDSALFQGAGEVAVPALQAVGKGAGAVAKKAMTTVLGPNGKEIDNFLLRPNEVKSAKSVEGIKDAIDESVGKLLSNVENSKATRDEAKAGLKQIEDQIYQAQHDGQLQFRLKQADLKDAMKEAHAKLDSAFAVEKDQLSSIKSPTYLSDEVQAALQDGKKQLSKLSSEGYEILGKHAEPVSIQEPFRAIGRAAKNMDIAGAGPITDEAIAAQQKLTALADRVGKMPVNIPATEAKKAIQQLDNAIEYGGKTGSFTSDVQQELKTLRRGLDAQLKQVPGYADKMAEAHELAKVLEQASDSFGTPQLAISKLNQIASRTAGPSRDTLGALGSATGRDFLSPVDQYVQAQGTLKDPRALDQIKRALPEFKPARMQEAEYYRGQRPDASKQYLESYLAKQGLPAKQAQATSSLANAQEGLAKSTEALEPFKQLSPNSTQSRIQSLMKNPGKENIETRRALEALGKVSNKDFVQWINDRRTADAFKGSYTNGSRNVVIFSALLGSTFGPGAIPVGIAIGGTIDRFGPQIAQKILEGVVKANGVLSHETIQALQVPKEVKVFLSAKTLSNLKAAPEAAVEALPRSAEMDRDSSISSSQPVLKGSDKWAADGFEKIKQSGVTGVSKDEMMKDPKMRELLIKASDLKPGSKAMDALLTRIKTKSQKDGE